MQLHLMSQAHSNQQTWDYSSVKLSVGHTIKEHLKENVLNT